MSDTSGGPGWWQASDDRWYPPETHPDYRAPVPQQPTAGLSDFAPPNADQRYPIPSATALGAPTEQSAPSDAGTSDSGAGDSGAVAAIGRYPAAPHDPTAADFGAQNPGGPNPSAPYQNVPKKRSTGKVLAIIFGVVFLLLAGGCGLFVYNFRDQIADATVDFTDAEPVDVDASCEVVGTGFGENYGVDATLAAHSEEPESHYELTFELLAPDGELLGEDRTVFRAMAPGEERTEDAFNTILISAEVETVSCEVTGVRRVSA